MARFIIRSKIKPGEVERNVELLRGFFEELISTDPAGLRYAAFQVGNEGSFVHLVETEHGAAPFAHLPAYRRFRQTVEERCDEPPVMTELHEIGSFRFP
jgi:quinol monooxygenase YgiN